MGVGAGLYVYDVSLKSSRSLSHLLVSSCTSFSVSTIDTILLFISQLYFQLQLS